MASSPPSAMLALGVAKAFAGGARALDGVTLEIRAGEILGLAGANGSGKSTLLRTLAGKFPPDQGRVEVLGRDPAHPDRTLRGRMSYLPQEQALDPEMTARETLRLFQALHGLSRPRGMRVAEDLLAEFGLEQAADRRVSTYSGGMRQRLHLSLALLHSPSILLFDEPTAGLDPEGRRLLWRILRAQAERGAAVAVATHDLAEAAETCQRMAFLEAGKLLVEGSPAVIVERHGSAGFKAAIGRRTGDPDALGRRLSQRPGVIRYEIADAGISVGLQEGSVSDAELVEILESEGFEVRSYEHRRPDLAGAYFNLSGRSLAGIPPAGGRGRRRRHA